MAATAAPTKPSSSDIDKKKLLDVTNISENCADDSPSVEVGANTSVLVQNDTQTGETSFSNVNQRMNSKDTCIEDGDNLMQDAKDFFNNQQDKEGNNGGCIIDAPLQLVSGGSSADFSCDTNRAEPINVEGNDGDESSSFLMVYPEEETANKTFYLFARTSREKEEWYNHFVVAANFMQDWEHQNPKMDEAATGNRDPDYKTHKLKQQQFQLFMEDYLQAKSVSSATVCREGAAAATTSTQSANILAREQLAFLNIFFARMWHDLHDSKVFLDYLREKISRKLLKVKIAQYFGDVRVTTLDLGPKLPQVLSASLPWQDELGLWVNLEIEYTGICQATVETQGIRLPGKDEPDREAQELARLNSRQAATMDSEEEDSAEEDDDTIHQHCEDNLAGAECDLKPHAGFKSRVLESILKSELVAKVAESEWVKKNITNKNITLRLQLHLVRGTFTLNFPPAPSDRIWYGFRTPPQLEIAIKPCFGGYSLGRYEGTLATVMKHLEKRLKREIMKVLVYPNLDDEVLPFMDHVPYSLGGNWSETLSN